MRNAILFLVVLCGILQPTWSFANGVLDTKTTKDKHYILEKTMYSTSHSLEGLSISFSRKHVSCKGQNDGKLIAQVTGGTAPYQYQWNTGATTESIDNLVAGVYRLTITDATGQEKSSGVKITEPEQLILRAAVQHVSCGATKDGRMEVVAEGGRAPYQYTWEIGGSGTVRENMPAGKYPVSVTDANGCIATTCPELVAAQPPLLAIRVESPSCIGNGQDGKAFLTVVESIPPYYDIAWSTGDTQKEVIPQLAPGDYSVTVTNTAGCSSVANVSVPAAGGGLQVTIEADAFVCGNSSDGQAIVNVTGGSPPYQYQWSHGPTSSFLNNLSAGDYTVLVTDKTGCSKESSFSIKGEEAPSVKVIVPGKICFGENANQITAEVTGGAAPYTYEWNTGSTTAQLTNIPTGTYSVTVTGANGCSTIATNRVFNFSEINFDYTTKHVTCPNGSDGQISTTVSEGTRIGFTYQWSTGSTNANLTDLSAGTYTLTLTDRGSKCTIIEEIIIIDPPPIQITPTITPASSEDVNDGAASIAVTGGTPGYTYEWSNGTTTPTITDLASGTYTVTVTDSRGCTQTSTIVISANCILEVQLFPTPITCLGNDGSIVAEAKHTNHSVTYQWSTGQTGRSINDLVPGTYSVTATDGVGCIATATVTLEDNQILLGEDSSNGNNTGGTNSGNNGSSITIRSVSCHGGADGQISVMAVGGTGNGFTYAWSNGQTGETATNLTAGTYTVSVTDIATGCTITRNITVTEPSPIVIQPTVVNASDEASADGSISLVVSGGTAPYTYSWNTETTSSSIQNIPFGTYTVTVTDANGCTETLTITVDPSCTLEVKLFPTAVSCKGNDGNIVAETTRTNEAVTFTWSNGQTGRSIIGLSHGTYSVTATDAAGCMAVGSISLADNRIFLGEDAGETGNIIIDDSNSSGNSNDNTIRTVFSNNSFVEIKPISCHGGSDGQISVIAKGGTGNGFSYSWNTGQTDQTANNLTAGTYTVSVTDTATGCTITRNITITEPTPIILQPTVINASDENTADGSASVQVTGGTPPYTYEWSNGATTASISNIPFGTFSVKVTDANGCMETVTVTIDPICTIEVQLTPVSISCRGNDGSISAQATRTQAAVTYAWSNGQSGQTITNLGPGTYSVTATEANVCIAVGSVTLEDNKILLGGTTADGGILGGDDPNSSIATNTTDNTTTRIKYNDQSFVEIQSVSCHGLSDGQISVIAQGGSGSGLSYSWSNGQTGQTTNNLVAGNYTVSVTDAATGCTITRNIIITQPDPILIQHTVINASDENTADGSITLQVTGGTPPYTYEWSNGATTASITNVPFGTYTVTVTDANGCMEPITIIIDPICTIAIQVTPVSISCRGNDGSISAQASGTKGAVTYSWSTGQTGPTIVNLGPGTYNVTATDAAGCVAIGSATLQDNQIVLGDSNDTTGGNNSGGNNSGNPSSGNAGGTITSSGTFDNGSSVTIQAVSCHGGNDGQISVLAQGGTGSGLSYSWSNGQSGPTITNLTAGTYTVTITDNATGCSITKDIVVTEPTPIIIQPTTINATDDNTSDGAITVDVTGGTPPYTYQWSNEATTATITNIPAGTYSVTVTDANGCQVTETIIVSANCSLEATVSSIPVSCTANDGTISLQVANANGTVTYRWSNGRTGQTLSGLEVGFYSVTATDELGCTISSGGFIEDGCNCVQPQITTLVVMEATGQEETDGFIELMIKGGNSRFDFQWSNGATGAAINNLSPDLYMVTISDRIEPACNLVRNVTVGNSTIKIGPVEITSTTGSECGLNNGSAELFPSGLNYQWSDGGTGAVRNNLAPGTYTVTATLDQFPGERDIVEVVIETIGGLNASANVTQLPDCGNNNGSATINATEGSGNYSYSWGPSNTRTDLTSGTYSVTVTDQVFGCEDIVTFLITDNIPPVTVEAFNIQPVSCNGGSDGIAQYNIITTNQVVQPVTQRITDGLGNTFNPTNLPAGQYCLEILDGNNCIVGGDCFEITEPDELFVEVSRIPVTCSTQGIMIIKAKGGNGDYIFDWTDINGEEDAPSRNDVDPGVYAINVSDSKGCDVFIDNIVMAEPIKPTVSLETISPATLTSNDGSISVIAEGGLPPFRYLWSTQASGVSTIEGLSPGDYSVTVVDANGCVEILDTTLEAICTFDITTEIQNTGCDLTDGSIQLTVIGGTGTVSYLWSTGATSNTITNLTPGLYSVTVVDEGECLYEEAFEIINGCSCVDPVITSIVTVKETVPNSQDGSIIVQVAADNPQFIWSDPSLSGNSITGLSAGVYKVTITDGECETTETIPVSNGTIPTIETVSTTNTPCGESTGSATLSPPTLTYDWSDGGTGNARDGLAAGEYIITATDPNLPGVAIAVVNIESVGGLNTFPVIDRLPDCGQSNGVVRINASGGSGNFSYSWGDSNTRTNLPSGTYSITVTDQTLDCKEVVQFTLLDNVPDVEVTTTTTRVTCVGDTNGSVQVNLIPSAGANGPFTQTITDGTGKEFDSNRLAAGNYCVEVRDRDGCIAGSDCFAIMSPEPILVEVTPTLSSCQDDGTLSLDIKGGNGEYIVDWADIPGTSNTINRTGLMEGSYSFEVTDRNGCNARGEATIRKIGDPQLTISSTNATDLTSNDGTASAIVSEGTPPYTFEWSNGASTQSIDNLIPGTYEVTVTDANGCTATTTTEIIASCTLLIGDITFGNLPDCGASDGEASIEVINATDVRFSWGPTNSRNNLAAGDYNVTVTDNATSCAVVASFTLPNEQATAKATITPLEICEGSTGTLVFNIERSACFENPMEIRIQNAAGNTFAFNDLPEGDYSLIVLDGNGVTITTEDFSVTTIPSFGVMPTINAATCDEPGAITLEVEDGNENYQFNWADIDDIINDANRPAIAADTYEVTITDTRTNCTQTQSYTVPNEGLDVTAQESEFTCDGDPIQLSVINNKNSDNLVYNWSPANAILSGGNTGTPTVQVDSVQEFTYTVENQFGCSQSGSIMVTSANTMPPGMITQAQQCTNMLVEFESSGGATDYYIWDFGDGNTSNEANPSHEYMLPGNYQVTLRLDPDFPCADDLGIITNQLVEVKDSVSTEASFETDFEPCEDEGLVSFRNTSDVSPGPVSYFWNFGNGMTSTEENPIIQLDQNIDLNISLTVNTPFGCEDVARDNIEIEVFKKPTVFDTIKACAGIPTALNPTPSEGAFKYSWTPAEVLDDANSASPMVMVNKTTRVDVVIRDSVCEVKSSVLVEVPDDPDFELVEDMAVCSAEDQVFFVDVETAGDILWASTSSFSDTISTEPEFIAEPGTYHFRFTDEANCVYEDEVEIANAMIEAEVSSDMGSIICARDGATLTVINTKPNFEIVGYEWMDGPSVLNTDLNSTSLVVQPDATTEYSVIVTNEVGCMDTLSQVIELSDIEAQIMLTASPETIFIGQTSDIELTPTAPTIIWVDDPTNSPTRTVMPMQTTNYMVTIRDENGCEATDMVTVVVENPACEPPNIFFPNAFSPNGDGFNDVLRLRGNGIESAFWQIFNRWGQLVFEANSLDTVWDGTFNGDLVDPDVYGYILRVECFNGDVYESQGNVTVLR